MASKIMSDGRSDGIVMFYVKDLVIYPVMLTQSELDTLNEAVPMAFDGPIKVVNTPMGELGILSKDVQLVDNKREAN